VVASLATLDRKELTELIAEGQPLQISCDFCGKDYAVTPEHIRGLLSES
jgi:molecular chaperone Hsp33